MTDRARLLVRTSSAALVITASLQARTTSHVGSGSQTQPPRPVFKTEANYVREDVFRTLDGEPVADLTHADFEILEDRVLQKIDAFERIAIGPAGPQDTRREPQTVAESRAMAADPHTRVFVIAQLSLAPLAPGAYLIEEAAGSGARERMRDGRSSRSG